ncbi:Hypothetical predicted protein [Octopus vulgaris]|uniref:Uncharacterized protein n=1 Tax=Octopus vulgaris TaxID=6645 RepID=A0AA36FB75_OCTVU|nr:Hypothetical predicted protein [Octopus vulgaris]
MATRTKISKLLSCKTIADTLMNVRMYDNRQLAGTGKSRFIRHAANDSLHFHNNNDNKAIQFDNGGSDV